MSLVSFRHPPQQGVLGRKLKYQHAGKRINTKQREMVAGRWSPDQLQPIRMSWINPGAKSVKNKQIHQLSNQGDKTLKPANWLSNKPQASSKQTQKNWPNTQNNDSPTHAPTKWPTNPATSQPINQPSNQSTDPWFLSSRRWGGCKPFHGVSCPQSAGAPKRWLFWQGAVNCHWVPCRS